MTSHALTTAKNNPNHDEHGRFSAGEDDGDDEPEVSDADAKAHAAADDKLAEAHATIEGLHNQLADHLAGMQAIHKRLGKATDKGNKALDAMNEIRGKYGLDEFDKNGSILEHGEELHEATGDAVSVLKPHIGDKYGDAGSTKSIPGTASAIHRTSLVNTMPRHFVVKAYGVETAALPDRQISVRISTDQVDRSGDVVVQKGIRVDNFKASRTVLWNHDHDHPVASCVEIGLKDGGLVALTQFPEPGISAKADEVYGLLKAGVINAASIGFMPLAAESVDARYPRKGLRINECDLMEFSFVSVPANPGAQVLQRSLRPRTRSTVPALTRKGLYAVSQLAYILNELGYQVDGAIDEASREGDASTVPDQLRAAMAQLGAALVAMTTEEVNEMLAQRGTNLVDPGDDVMLLSMLRGVLKGAGPTLKQGRKFSAATATAMRGHLGAIADAQVAMCGILDEAEVDHGNTSAPECKHAAAGKARRGRELAVMQARA